jgi:hypothetical protein
MSCQPTDCPPTPAPVMPRCDVVLDDGTFANATIVVENGCIVGVQLGSLPVYTPDMCCPPEGGGGGGGGGGGANGLDGEKGLAGTNATIALGAVTSLPAGALPTVTNVGTLTAAILNFGIPRGAAGLDGGNNTVGETVTAAGIVLENGLIKDVPVQWPPIMHIGINPVSTAGVSFTAVEDPATGIALFTLDIAAFVTTLEADFNQQLVALSTIITALQTQIISLQEAVLTCCPASVLDLDGNGVPDPGGVPGINPPPPVSPN